MNLMTRNVYHITHLSREFIGQSAVKSNASPNLMVSHIYHSTHLSCGFIGESSLQPHASLNSFMLERGLITRSRGGLWLSGAAEYTSSALHHNCTQNTQWSDRLPSGLMLLQVANNEHTQLYLELQVGKMTYLNIFFLHLSQFSYRIQTST
jgi:hypothetical protein